MMLLCILAVVSGSTTTLLWLAFVGVAGLALVLYWPRKFSGPLTEGERRLARRRLRWRSLALTLATPLCTVFGLLLLLPPRVKLEVTSHVLGQDRSVECKRPVPWLSGVAWTERTYPWVEAVCCELPPEYRGGRDALRDALVRATERGFARPADCDAERVRRCSPADIVDIELSLVEIAARAYALTRVEFDVGPRMADPDPWDIIAGTLDARDIHVCPDETRDGVSGDKDTILRLTRARFNERAQRIEVFAVVKGNPCAKYPAVLAAQDPAQPVSCTLSSEPSSTCETDGQRVVRMHLEGDERCSPTALERLRERHRGVVLTAGHGRTRVQMFGESELIRVETADDFIRAALAVVEPPSAFTDELTARSLAPLKHVDQAGDIVVEVTPNTIVVRTQEAAGTGERRSVNVDELDDGPFSWSGFSSRPTITCAEHRVEIGLSPVVLDPRSSTYDPTTLYAVMSTIAWAANVLTSGTCTTGFQPLPAAPHVGARPLLAAAEIDAAVAAMRRGREALGLLLLAIALGSLALGLRRSVR